VRARAESPGLSPRNCGNLNTSLGMFTCAISSSCSEDVETGGWSGTGVADWYEAESESVPVGGGKCGGVTKPCERVLGPDIVKNDVGVKYATGYTSSP